MKKKSFCWAIALLAGLVACSEPAVKQIAYPVADVRSVIDREATLGLADEIAGVEYVPLKETDDDASLIDGVLDYAVTSRYIYVMPVQEPRIVLYDRQGNFVKTLVREGQGPGEFAGLVSAIQADEANDRLYLFGSHIWIYTLEGEFISQTKLDAPMAYMQRIGEDRYAAVAMPFIPFQSGSFGIGVFSEKGEMLYHKNDFYSNLLSKEKTGFTVHLAKALAPDAASLLFKAGSNDTVFRVQADSVSVACVLDLQNSDEEVIRSLDATDFSDIQGMKRSNREIFVWDIFETPSRFYFRCRYNQGFQVVSVDKKTNEVVAEKCEQPGTLEERAKTTLQHGMLGTRSYQNFPIWGRTCGNELVQIVTPAEVDYYKELGTITIPQELQDLGTDGNPVFLFYKLKE